MEEAVIEKLIAQLKAALVRYYEESDPTDYAALYADKVTSFDPWSDGRKDDGAAVDHLMASAGTIPRVDYELVDPRVDLVGDAAVFTFGLEVHDPATGARLAIWNATQVHDLSTDGLKLVHTHFSFAVPPTEDPAEE